MSAELSQLMLRPMQTAKDQLDWKAFSKELLNATHNGNIFKKLKCYKLYRI